MKNRISIALCTVSLLLFGCSMQGGQKIDMANVKKIEKGKTTKEQILQLMGKPTLVSQSSVGETWSYAHVDSGYYILILPMTVGDKHTDNVSITFEGDVVKDYTWSTNTQQ